MKNRLLFSLVFFCSAAAWAQFEHPDLKSGKKHVNRIVLMPITAEIVKVGMKGGEPMVEESRQAAKALAPVISSVLTDVGCEVQDASLSPEALQKEPELAYLIDDLQKQYNAILQQMTRKSKDVRKGRFSIGDSISRLPANGGADAVLFVHVNGQVLTGGKKTFNWLVIGPAFDSVRIRMGLVDAGTGEVLYFAKPLALKNITKGAGAAQAKPQIAKSFKNFLKANKAAQAVKTGSSP